MGNRVTWVQRYGPFVVIAVSVAVLLGAAPSRLTRVGSNGGQTALAENGTGTDGTATAASDGGTTNGATGGTGPGGSGAVRAGGRTAGAAGGQATAGGGPVTTLPPNGIYGQDCARQKILGPTYTCKPLWKGTNPGSTYKGVTGTSITVVYYIPKANPAVNAVLAQGGLAMSQQQIDDAVAAYKKFFDQYTQTWGRNVDVKQFQGTADTGDSAAFRADAASIDQDVHAAFVFGGNDTSFIDELARRKIVCLCGAQLPAKFNLDRAPYVYGILPDGDTTNEHIAEFVCRRLGPNSTAEWGGNPRGTAIHTTIPHGAPRKYSVSYPNDQYSTMNGKDMVARLAKCGIKVDLELPYASDINTAAQQATAAETAAIKAGITTQICLCDPFAPLFGGNAAKSQNYYPESVISGYQLIDAEALARLYDQDEWQNAFGISTLPAPQAKEQSTWYQVFKMENPNTEPSPDDAVIFPYFQIIYAGIELAGTTLNPTTFHAGMSQIDIKATNRFQTTFSYANNSYSGLKDAREIWWDPNGTAPDGNKGYYQMVDLGKRYLIGQWPATPTKAFKPECLGNGSCGEPSWSSNT